MCPARKGWTPGVSAGAGTHRAPPILTLPGSPVEDNAAPRGELTCSKSCSNFLAVAKYTDSVTTLLLSSPNWNSPTLPLPVA